jgi:hypothetical protein
MNHLTNFEISNADIFYFANSITNLVVDIVNQLQDGAAPRNKNVVDLHTRLIILKIVRIILFYFRGIPSTNIRLCCTVIYD